VDPTLHPALNDAIETHLDAFCTPECRHRIAATYGPAVAAATRAVYDAAMETPVDWSSVSLDAARDAMLALLARDYPWLTPAARQTLGDAFTTVWQ
jgi:hypothetical protein